MQRHGTAPLDMAPPMHGWPLSPALARDGRVFCWAADAHHGRLGRGARKTGKGGAQAANSANGAWRPCQVAGLPSVGGASRCRPGVGDKVEHVTFGHDHSAYARTRRGRVYAWGRGIGGQLGLGATERDHDEPRLVGPVPGRVVTGVFVAHDQRVWVSCAAVGERRARVQTGESVGRAGQPEREGKLVRNPVAPAGAAVTQI